MSSIFSKGISGNVFGSKGTLKNTSPGGIASNMITGFLGTAADFMEANQSASDLSSLGSSLDAQASEVERRARINRLKQVEAKEQFKGIQVSGFARGGIDISSGSPLEIMAESEAIADRAIAESDLQVREQVRQLRVGAAGARRKAKKGRKIAGIKAATSILTMPFGALG